VLVGRHLLVVDHVAQLERGVVDALGLLAELVREADLGRHQPAEEIEGHRIRFATGTGKSDHSPGAAGR
jgi:hypothetical protein